MTILTPAQFVTQLRARIRRDGWKATAEALGVAVATLQNVTNGQAPGEALLTALGYQRAYRNGKGKPYAAEALRDKAIGLVRVAGTYEHAATALGLTKSELWHFVNGRKAPTTGVAASLGFAPVFVDLAE